MWHEADCRCGMRLPIGDVIPVDGLNEDFFPASAVVVGSFAGK